MLFCSSSDIVVYCFKETLLPVQRGIQVGFQKSIFIIRDKFNQNLAKVQFKIRVSYSSNNYSKYYSCNYKITRGMKYVRVHTPLVSSQLSKLETLDLKTWIITILYSQIDFQSLQIYYFSHCFLCEPSSWFVSGSSRVYCFIFSYGRLQFEVWEITTIIKQIHILSNTWTFLTLPILPMKFRMSPIHNQKSSKIDQKT